MISQYVVWLPVDSSVHDRQQAESFAQMHRLPIQPTIEELNSSTGAFMFCQDALALYLLLDGRLNKLSFDLDQGEVASRVEKASKSNELIAKAIGCKPHYRPRVLDLTAGMGRDSMIMATLGCQVVMQERSFAIGCLLDNAFFRLQKHQQFSGIANRMKLIQADSLETIIDKQQFEVVYLDPMFPERKKSALVKKEMRLFKQLVGDDLDADQLLTKALTSQIKRVVVKRPKGAPCLNGPKPNHEVSAKKFRYDVYLNIE